MALALNIMRGGFSAGQAKAINGSIASAVSAAGTTIATATDLVADINFVSTVGSSAGVQLASGELGDSQIVHNSGANPLSVYPPSATHGINQIPVGSAHILSVDTTCTYYIVSTTQIIGLLSA